MFELKSRQDSFKLILPKEFLCKEIEEKYSRVLQARNNIYTEPIDFLNESIQKIQVFGFQNASYMDSQGYRGEPMINPNRISQNKFLYPKGEVPYRSPDTPLNLIDKTLNVEFKLSVGFLNYIMVFENFFYKFSRDRKNEELDDSFEIDLFNEKGVIYAKILLFSPIIDGMDFLDLDFSRPIAESQTFKVEFKYANIDFQFLDIEPVTSDVFKPLV